ncbi:MAG: hypothetical protein ACP5RY_03480, partial [Thermoplasmata archaeon]
MSESLKVVITGSYEARVKIILATGMIKADRQRGQLDLNKAQIPRCKTTGLNENEPVYSVVKKSRSNAVSGCAEPIYGWRRQYSVSTNPARMLEHPGVVGWACGEGYSR